ncbi:MAG TPA: lipid-binding SYLF domain-containing protein [Noviherbaspirillum sp.]|nr:lipid-binding SYLF domain-containing protein [Noviherbaspirillum sp.]
MVRQNGQWSEPLFYNLGGISIGLQAGVEAGDVAFVLNNQRAVDNFLQRNNWSLDAHAGLTVGTWAGKAQADAGRGDITIWTDAAGISGNLAVSIANINFDQEETYAYYGRQVAVQDVVGGRVTNPHSRILQQTLAAVAGPTATGAAATGAGAAGSGASGYGHQGGQQDMAPSR